jgi:hypothetical protein
MPRCPAPRQPPPFLTQHKPYSNTNISNHRFSERRAVTCTKPLVAMRQLFYMQAFAKLMQSSPTVAASDVRKVSLPCGSRTTFSPGRAGLRDPSFGDI